MKEKEKAHTGRQFSMGEGEKRKIGGTEIFRKLEDIIHRTSRISSRFLQPFRSSLANFPFSSASLSFYHVKAMELCAMQVQSTLPFYLCIIKNCFMQRNLYVKYNARSGVRIAQSWH